MYAIEPKPVGYILTPGLIPQPLGWSLTEEAGGAAMRLAGMLGGYFLAPLVRLPRIAGAAIGYAIAVVASKVGG